MVNRNKASNHSKPLRENKEIPTLENILLKDSVFPTDLINNNIFWLEDKIGKRECMKLYQYVPIAVTFFYK